MQSLINIQQKLKAPKNQKNNFGNYMYRSAEDILEAVKPILKEEKTALIIEDEIVNIGARYYVKATAKLFNSENKLIAQSSAFAREEESKKGQDGSQVTGASSSYARKYALNGLFAIDDTKDSDTTNKGEQKEEPKEPEINENDLDIIEGLKGMDCKENAHQYFKTYENEVSDKEGFKKAYANLYVKLPSLEELQNPAEL